MSATTTVLRPKRDITNGLLSVWGVLVFVFLFLPIVMHRIVFTPSFVATAREIGWDAAAASFREQCLALAPRPGTELQEPVALAG